MSEVQLTKRDGLNRTWLTATGALAIGVILLVFVFRREAVSAVYVWRTSTAFNHCFLVPFVIAYLAWEKRDALSTTPATPAPLWWISIAALPVAIGWFAAERLGFMEGQQLFAIAFVQILILGVLGFLAARVFAAPILYLFFLVPFGDFLVPWLQTFTAHFITKGLDFLSIPNYGDGVVIEIPEGRFHVAEACAGLRFLIASLAFGVLYACIMYYSIWRRLIFIFVSLVVPIVANGIRALGTIVVAHVIGNSQAVEIDHIFYGWLFFSLVTILLMLLGLPFRDRPRDAIPRSSKPRVFSIIKPTGLVVAIMTLTAAAPRLFAAYLDAGPPPAFSQLAFPALAGCEFVPVLPTFVVKSPATDLAASTSRAYQCDSHIFVVTLLSLPARIGARPLFIEQGLSLEELGSDTSTTARVNVGAGPEAQSWAETEFTHDGHFVISASALWVAGRPSVGIHGRLSQALNSMQRSPRIPVVAVVIYDAAEKADHPFQVLDDFLVDLTPLSGVIDRFADSAGASGTDHQ